MKKLLLLLILICFAGCKLYNSPSGEYYPYWWGEPPKIETKDHVLLPDNFGHGSSTLKNWISLNTKRDKLEKQMRQLNNELSKFKTE
jgi:hypothetical protein